MQLILIIPLSAALLTPQEDLTRILSNAQLYNAERYQSGELHATLRIDQTGAGLPTHEFADVTVAWSGAKVWVRAQLWGPQIEEIVPDGPTDHIEEVISLPDRVIYYYPNSQNLAIEAKGGNELPLYARLSPKESWFGPLGLHHNWRRVLDPSLFPGSYKETTTTAAKRQSQDLIQVVQQDSKTGYRAQAVFSLANDGNVVEFHISSPEGKYTAEGEYEWSKNERSLIYPRSQTTKFTQNVGGDDIIVTRELRIDQFEQKAIPNSRFTLESLRLPKGTLIRDELSGRVRRTGDTSPEDVSSRLDGLINSMKGRGFAKP